MTAYVFDRKNAIQIDIEQPQFLKDLIGLIQNELPEPTQVTLTVQRAEGNEVLGMTLFDSATRAVNVSLSVIPELTVPTAAMVKTTFRYIAVEVKDLFDAMCVAQYLARHFTNGGLNLSPSADSFESIFQQNSMN